ncbi:hypothetical protein F5144DRAFT_560673 [Chaetomium tenue]|uniref:Uncharacterized protein n=1 Tax=Chaetomium tenue TaxID=1854479 RepID=A0ACB7PJE2_9PEZI|nr:hypothetical protein F5144DRAFT_560673 [Chaetomium globosum]
MACCPSKAGPGAAIALHSSASWNFHSHVANSTNSNVAQLPKVLYLFCRLHQFASQPSISFDIAILSTLSVTSSQSSINTRRDMAPPSFPKTSGFWRVDKLENDLMNLAESETTLSTSRLKNMNIERAPELNIDSPDAVDAHPVFFQPFPDNLEYREALAETRRDLEENELEWSTCTKGPSHVGQLDCACRIIHWLAGLRQGTFLEDEFYPTDIPQWRTATPGGGVRLPNWTPRGRLRWYTSSLTYVPDKTLGEEGVRHVKVVLADTTSHNSQPNEALRSEITAGVSFIKRRMADTRDTHSIIPILLYSFYHNDTARITQMCWNGEQKPITFRQSRLVDISSESLDTPDVSILLRWMDCIPLRKPKVLPRRGAARAGGTTLQPGRPTTSIQGGTPQSGTKASLDTTPRGAQTVRINSPAGATTPTTMGTQRGPAITSGNNKTTTSSATSTPTPTQTPTQRQPNAATAAATNQTRPHSAAATAPQRPPNATTATAGNSHPRPTISTATNQTPSRSGTPTTPRPPPNAITATTGNSHPRPTTGTGNASGAHTAVSRQGTATPGRNGTGATSPPRTNPAPGPSQTANLATRNANGNGRGGGAPGNGNGSATQQQAGGRGAHR